MDCYAESEKLYQLISISSSILVGLIIKMIV